MLTYVIYEKQIIGRCLAHTVRMNSRNVQSAALYSHLDLVGCDGNIGLLLLYM